MSQAAQKEKAAKAPPVKLKPLHLIGVILLLLVSIAFMAFGAVMMTVLMGN